MAHIEKTEHVIDASGKRLGILATEVSSLLLGKRRADFAKHTIAPVSVKVINASKLDLSEKRKASSTFKTYSGYPSGQRVETLAHLGTRQGYAEVVRRTVKGMLPHNKLESEIMRNLEVTD